MHNMEMLVRSFRGGSRGATAVRTAKQQCNGGFMMKKSILILATLAMAGLAVPALGQAPAIDYLGYGWEDGGFPPSDPGDVLYVTCVGVSADPVFGVDLGTEELTVYIYGLTSTGGVDIGGGTIMVNYTGGYLEIYRDGAMNADFGVNPPNGTAPSTFMDGELFFKGEFIDFVAFLGPTGGGSFEGNLNGIGGSMIDSVCNGCAYTWGGEFTTDAGAQIIEGYDLQIDGVFEIEEAVPVESATWGNLKALYRK